MNTKPIIVPWGEMRHSIGPDLKSGGVTICSAIVFDYEIGSSFVHALPKVKSGKYIGVNTAIVALVDYVHSLGVDSKNIKAYVNAASRPALDTLAKECMQYGIELVDGNTDYAPLRGIGSERTVVYSKATKTMSVIPVRKNV